jgi:hypothetical protein
MLGTGAVMRVGFTYTDADEGIVDPVAVFKSTSNTNFSDRFGFASIIIQEPRWDVEPKAT